MNSAPPKIMPAMSAVLTVAAAVCCAWAAAQSPTLFKQDWVDSLPADTVRVATADTVGDGKARLIVLQQKGGHGTVSIKRWDGQAWKLEFTTDVPGPADKLAVGHFSSLAPAVIATPGALIYYNGATYQRVPSISAVDILGSVILNDSSEHLLIKQATAMKMVTVNPATNGEWVTNPMDPPGSDASLFTELRAPTAELTGLGIPPALAEGSVLGVWMLPTAKKLALYRVQIVTLTDLNPKGAAGNKVLLKGVETHLQVLDPKTPGFPTMWLSASVDGNILDVARRDARTGAEGLMVLSAPPKDALKDSPTVSLTFYKLQ